ncbi:hypothetical protein [Schleiferilactobacillus perolens]|uniref:hypothetical protein n=1 Tax=Schleiferilactobacillus perolens TaxID=100468 RepID=UPI00071110E2|nr:hypothetical protein [Schleiferilactobacillus perolens]
MNHEDLKAREDIKKRLLDLAAEANGIKDYELGELILAAYNRCDDNMTMQNCNLYANGNPVTIDNAALARYLRLLFTGDNKAPSGNASYISTLELKDDGPCLNGKPIKGLIDMSIDSKAGDLTKVVIKLAANVHGIDDIKQERSFYGF